jgi:opacity protein-like surface antigen
LLHAVTQQIKEIGTMKLRSVLFMAVCTVGLALSAFAADVAGQWTATFNTQIGEQHYTYTFKVDGEKLTGTAKNDMGSTEIVDGKIKGDDISFVENLNFNGNQIVINYTGKIAGDEIKFTRKVGEFATEELVAKRAK